MTTNQDTVKAAAKRMCALLATKGVAVKQTQMLEALAEGFGLNNWRTLKALIDQPRAAKRKEVPLGVEQQWTVEALYRDNQQQYGDYFHGRTPLEAAYACMVERLTDFGLEVDVLDVTDADGNNRLSVSFAGELQLRTNRAVFQALADAAQGVSAAAQWTGDKAHALKWLLAVLAAQPHEDFAYLTDYKEAQHATETAPVSAECALTPVDALRLLASEVEVAHGGVVQLEQRDRTLAECVYQVLAVCDYFGKVLNDPNHGGLTRLVFGH